MRSLSHLVPQPACQPIPLAVVFEKASPLVATAAFEMQMLWSCNKLPQGTAISRHCLFFIDCPSDRGRQLAIKTFARKCPLGRNH